MAGHARKKLFQFADGRRERDWASVRLESSGVFPKLPPREQAPEELRTALRRDVDDILRGHWKAFGHLELKVDDPPKWHCDYLAGQDLVTTRSAFQLNHRTLPEGADIKLIWELSRWQQLVRLAQAAYVLGDERAGRKCVAWLEDWVTHNPPYRGWNWTSALEAGMRLIQFAWIDALLNGPLTPALSPSEGERVPNARRSAETPLRPHGPAALPTSASIQANWISRIPASSALVQFQPRYGGLCVTQSSSHATHLRAARSSPST